MRFDDIPWKSPSGCLSCVVSLAFLRDLGELSSEEKCKCCANAKLEVPRSSQVH